MNCDIYWALLKGKVSAMGQPTRPTQPAILLGSGKYVAIHVTNYMDYGGGNH